MSLPRRPLLALLGAVTLVTSACRIVLPGDPLLHLDALDAARWTAAEIVPGTPMIAAGPDRRLGTRDDRVSPNVIGDVDLVLRTGRSGLGATVPPPAAASGAGSWPAGVADTPGAGTPIEYVVAPIDAWQGPPPGAVAAPPYWSGLPVLVLAFADLDGDGLIGVTSLDGDALDASIGEAELVPVGRRFTAGANGIATGALQIGVGGPSAAPARVLLAAAAWAGDFDPAYLGGHVPRGPAVTTRLPFVPETDPLRVLEGGANGPPPASPDALVGVEVRPAFGPDPTDPRFGESFTLRLDGSDVTTDAALVRSGTPARFGAVRPPDPASYVDLPARPLRPGVSPAATPIGVEVLRRVGVADDGPSGRTALRVVALDALGNVVEPAGATTVTLRTSGPLRIAFPDQDGLPDRETLLVSDAIGTAVELDDTGDALDGPDGGTLVVESAASLARIDALLPDPDVDDSGLVDAADVDAIRDARGERLGDPGFEAQLDLDASGRIDDGDEALATAALGAEPSVP